MLCRSCEILGSLKAGPGKSVNSSVSPVAGAEAVELVPAFPAYLTDRRSIQRVISSACMPPKFTHMRVPSLTIFATALSQSGQRMTIPAPRKTCIAPTAPDAPQLPHVMVAVVISTANTSESMPATALPSSINSSISASRWPEPFGLDRPGLVPEAHQCLGRSLDERRWATDIDVRPFGGARADLREHLRVDAARIARPAGRRRHSQRVHDREAVAVQPLEFFPVDDVVPSA